MCVALETPVSRKEHSGREMGGRMWVGIRDKSGEVYMGQLEGVITVRSVRRKGTAQARWDVGLWDKVKGVP